MGTTFLPIISSALSVAQALFERIGWLVVENIVFASVTTVTKFKVSLGVAIITLTKKYLSGFMNAVELLLENSTDVVGEWWSLDTGDNSLHKRYDKQMYHILELKVF